MHGSLYCKNKTYPLSHFNGVVCLLSLKRQLYINTIIYAFLCSAVYRKITYLGQCCNDLIIVGCYLSPSSYYDGRFMFYFEQ